jgi:hypothetical protein
MLAVRLYSPSIEGATKHLKNEIEKNPTDFATMT